MRRCTFLGADALAPPRSGAAPGPGTPGHGAGVVGDDGSEQVLLDVKNSWAFSLCDTGASSRKRFAGRAGSGTAIRRSAKAPSGRRPAVGLPCPEALCAAALTHLPRTGARRARQESASRLEHGRHGKNHLGHGTRRVRWPSCPRRRGRWKAAFWCRLQKLHQRALLVEAMADGPSEADGRPAQRRQLLGGGDVRALGVAVEVDGTTVRVEGRGAARPVEQGRLYVGSAGTLARFLPGALAAAPRGRWKWTAARSSGRAPWRRWWKRCGTWGPTSATPPSAPACLFGEGRTPRRGRPHPRQRLQPVHSGVLLAPPYAARRYRWRSPAGW